MMGFQTTMIVMQVAGVVVTVGILLLANARSSGRLEEKVHGLSRAMDNHQAINQREHASLEERNQSEHRRFDRELAEIRGKINGVARYGRGPQPETD